MITRARPPSTRRPHATALALCVALACACRHRTAPREEGPASSARAPLALPPVVTDLRDVPWREPGPAGPMDRPCRDHIDRVTQSANVPPTPCAELGYAGGLLRCDDAYDTNRCDGCLPGHGVLACTHAELRDTPGTVALATSGAEIGLAWSVRWSTDQSGGIALLRFHGDLTFVAESARFGPMDVQRLALASTPAGWIVAAQTPRGTEVFALDATGAVRGEPRLFADVRDPLLASGPDGATLLVWSVPRPRLHGMTLEATLLNERAQVRVAPALLFADVSAPDDSALIATRDGFLVATRQRAGVGVRRVGATGQLGDARNPVGPASGSPRLAWDGAQTTLVYYQTDPLPRGFAWASLDDSGAIVGPRHELLDVGREYGTAAAALAIDGTTLLLLGGSAHGEAAVPKLGLARLNATSSAPAERLSSEANGERYAQLARFEATAIAAWVANGWSTGRRTLYNGRITLARLRP